MQHWRCQFYCGRLRLPFPSQEKKVSDAMWNLKPLNQTLAMSKGKQILLEDDRARQQRRNYHSSSSSAWKHAEGNENWSIMNNGNWRCPFPRELENSLISLHRVELSSRGRVWISPKFIDSENMIAYLKGIWQFSNRNKTELNNFWWFLHFLPYFSLLALPCPRIIKYLVQNNINTNRPSASDVLPQLIAFVVVVAFMKLWKCENSKLSNQNHWSGNGRKQKKEEKRRTHKAHRERQ